MAGAQADPFGVLENASRAGDDTASDSFERNPKKEIIIIIRKSKLAIPFTGIAVQFGSGAGSATEVVFLGRHG